MRASKKMDVGQTMRHKMIMDEIQEEYESGKDIHSQQKEVYREGMRSSQISALVAYLIKKGVL
jgi:hypothetical protein